ncbi:MAG: hypothetical protein ACYCZB_07840 [Acidiphilium sp.]
MKLTDFSLDRGRAAILKRPPARVLLAVGIGVAILIGVIQSIVVTYHLWGADPDIADPVIVWRGLHSDGLYFIKIWHFTPDNWLLSLMPLDWLVFALIGSSPLVVIGTGAFFYLALIALCALLVGRERGAVAGGIVAVVLLFSARPAMADGFLTYAISHNISVMWGLLGLYLSTGHLGERRFVALAASGFCFLVATLSDPWTAAAFVLPILMASAILALLETDRKIRFSFCAIALTMLIVAIIVKTQVFGLLAFLPEPPHSIVPVPEMRRNLVLAARYVAVFFNLLPGTLTEPGQHPTLPVTAVDCLGFAFVVMLCVTRLILSFHAISPRRRFLALTALFSMGIMALALVLSGFATGMVTARYFANFFVFVPILVAMAPLGLLRHRGIDGVVVATFAGLLVASGIASDLQVWAKGPPHVRLNGIPELARFLEQHGLTYGYGPYWQTEASAVNWVTHGRVTIRPVNFNSQIGRFGPKNAQTLPRWYTPLGLRGEPKRTFLIVLGWKNACGPDISCLDAARRQFGTPDAVLKYQSLYILAYNRRIVPSFSNVFGNYWKFPNQDFGWIGRYAEIETDGRPYSLTISGDYRPAVLSPASLSVDIDGKHFDYQVGSATTFTLRLPPHTLTILHAAKTFVPAPILHNGDNRQLSVTIVLKADPPSAKP